MGSSQPSGFLASSQKTVRGFFNCMGGHSCYTNEPFTHSTPPGETGTLALRASLSHSTNVLSTQSCKTGLDNWAGHVFISILFCISIRSHHKHRSASNKYKCNIIVTLGDTSRAPLSFILVLQPILFMVIFRSIIIIQSHSPSCTSCATVNTFK